MSRLRLPEPDERWRDLGCGRDPCRPEPDPTLFFAPPAVASLLASVVGQLRHGPGGLFAVLGEAGAGKSMLLRVLEAELVEAGIAVIFHECDADDERWERALEAFASSSGRCVLLVDGAEMWDERAVAAMEAALAALGAVAGAGKQVVVGGRAALEARLQRLVAAGFAANLTFARLRLDPIDADQVGAFLLHRLRRSGFAGEQPLNAPTLRSIGVDSGGAPGRILELAAAELAGLKLPQARRIGGAAYAALALAGVGAGLLAWRAMENPQAPAAPVAWAAAPEAAPPAAATDRFAAATEPPRTVIDRVDPASGPAEATPAEVTPVAHVVHGADPAAPEPSPTASDPPLHEPEPTAPTSVTAAEPAPPADRPEPPQPEQPAIAPAATQSSDELSAPPEDALLSLAEILEIAPAAGGERLAEATSAAPPAAAPAAASEAPQEAAGAVEATPAPAVAAPAPPPAPSPQETGAKPTPEVAAPAPAPAPPPPPQEAAAKPAPAVAPATPPTQESAAAPPPPDARRALSAAQAEAYLGRAQDYLRSGDVAAARLLYERLAAAGDARGMTELVRTYDPKVLSRWGVVGLAADPQRAEHWYRKAAEAEAAARAKSP